MVGQLLKYNQRTLWDESNVTSLQESEDGQKLSDSQDVQTSEESGVLHCRVNRFRVPVDAEVRKMNGTCGLNSTASSASVALQSSLASNLAAKMGESGSLEYRLTWKSWDMPSGHQICALRASAGRTSDSESIGELQGWPTPNTLEGRGGLQTSPDAALRRKGQGHQLNLDDAVCLAGWSTCSARDHKDSPGMATTAVNPDGSIRERIDQLPRQVIGVIGTPSSVGTERSGGLDPEFARWLMAFPAIWDRCSPNWNEWQWTQKLLSQSDSGQVAGWEAVAETVSADYVAMETR